MSKPLLAAIPIKPFGVAKRRLSDRLDAVTRSRVGRAIAARTAEAATDAGALTAIVTGDPGVAAWARSLGYLTIEEDPGGLDGAARAALREAARRQRPWAVIHADLPLVTPAVLQPVFSRARYDTVLVPSHDGGTNVIASSGNAFSFAYGVGSFHRHVAHNDSCVVMTDPQLALDLDTKTDLRRAIEHPAGHWLRDLIR